jgi:ABC-type dipeptide/oligopeptide/nickel transport system permease component
LLLLVPVLIGVSLVSFALLQLVPGDPALILAGEEATEEVLTRIRQEYGLNRPLPIQFLAYLRHAVGGDLGISIQSRQPVATLLEQRFPFTLKLAFLAILVSAMLGVVAGIVAATRRNSPLDIAALRGSLVGISLPIFWLGLLAILIFSVKLRWLPAGGTGTFAHLILPALVLGAASSAVIARTTRASMLEVLCQDYVRTARAKGVSDRLVVSPRSRIGRTRLGWETSTPFPIVMVRALSIPIRGVRRPFSISRPTLSICSPAQANDSLIWPLLRSPTLSERSPAYLGNSTGSTSLVRIARWRRS